MKLVYRKSGVVDNLEIYTAFAVVPFYGREMEISISGYHFLQASAKYSALSFGIRPREYGDMSVSLRDGFLKITEPDRCLEQKINIPSFYGNILDKSDLTEGGVPGARIVCNAILRKFESIFETSRRHLLLNLSTPVRNKSIDRLELLYGKLSKNTLDNFLASINWLFLFPPTSCDSEMLGVIDYTLTHNKMKYYGLRSPIETDIPIIENKAEGVSAGSFADIKADMLLEQIIGVDEMIKYRRFGYVEVENFGYTFQISPSQWVKCTDPNGKKARLCIHTTGLSCNKTDEVVISYLHLKHEDTFMDYMKTAIYHDVQKDFQKPIDFPVVIG